MNFGLFSVFCSAAGPGSGADRAADLLNRFSLALWGFSGRLLEGSKAICHGPLSGPLSSPVEVSVPTPERRLQ